MNMDDGLYFEVDMHTKQIPLLIMIIYQLGFGFRNHAADPSHIVIQAPPPLTPFTNL